MSFSVDSFSAALRDVLCSIILPADRDGPPRLFLAVRQLHRKRVRGSPLFFFIINRHEERTSWKCCARAERGYLYYIYNVSSYIARENLKAKMKRSSSLSLSFFPVICELAQICSDDSHGSENWAQVCGHAHRRIIQIRRGRKCKDLKWDVC